VTPDEFRKHGFELIDMIADYLEGVGEKRIVPDIDPGDVRAMLPEHPPSEPETWDAVMADVEQIVVPTITHWQHPNWFAYFPSNTTYPSILGELLSAGLGVQGMSWVTSPACTEIETLMLDWMQELLALPDTFRSTSDRGGGVIQGSASEAALVAILAARWKATDGAINATGDTTRLTAYISAHAHSALEKGLRIAGIGTDRIRVVDHDDHFAMRPDALATAVDDDVRAGFVPFFVCTTHGTTSSMAFDPTAVIADICDTRGIWLHVDAAMSGIAALVPEHRWVNDGLDRVASYATNPHKWMGVNFDCTLFWVTERAALLGALSILPEFLRSEAAESGRAIDYRDWQVPLGRRFRALKLWFTIRLDGVESIRERIRRDVSLAQEFASWVDADHRFEIVAPHPLNLVCLRVAGEGDEATDTLVERINSAGESHVTRTVLDGRSVMRVSVGARTTEREHIEAFWHSLEASVDHADVDVTDVDHG
jgi:aromatic-L-amino-acid decarboxylase